ncbi:MAG: flagellar export protein FliJ [Cellulosilyticaceae bacterium]
MKFKLETILKLRIQNEENQKRELGKLRILMAQAQATYEKFLQEKKSLVGEYTQAVSGKILISELESMRRYLLVVDGQIKKQVVELQEIENRVSTQQLRLQEAMKERKIMENLKEVYLERWLEEEKRQEQLITDELVSYKYSVAEGSDFD